MGRSRQDRRRERAQAKKERPGSPVERVRAHGYMTRGVKHVSSTSGVQQNLVVPQKKPKSKQIQCATNSANFFPLFFYKDPQATLLVEVWQEHQTRARARQVRKSHGAVLMLQWLTCCHQGLHAWVDQVDEKSMISFSQGTRMPTYLSRYGL